MAVNLNSDKILEIFSKQRFDVRLYDIVAKYEFSNSISEVMGEKFRFSLKILRNGKEKSEKAP